MLICHTTDGRQYQWSIGLSMIYFNNVKSLEANGEELEYIKTNIKNLPTGNKFGKEYRWLGKDAQFIVDWLH